MNTRQSTTRIIANAGQAGRHAGLIAGLLAAGWLVGCSTPVKLDETPVETRSPTGALASGQAGAGGAGGAVGGAAAGGAGQGQVASVDLSRNAAGGSGAGGAAGPASLLGRVVYFDFDSFVVKDDYRSLIENHARALAANKARRMVVEGHADERGGSEYNLALGQKRAEAVSKALVLLGAAENQLEAVSFGKERPLVEGSDEAAMARNRRAELKDR